MKIGWLSVLGAVLLVTLWGCSASGVPAEITESKAITTDDINLEGTWSDALSEVLYIETYSPDEIDLSYCEDQKWTPVQKYIRVATPKWASDEHAIYQNTSNMKIYFTVWIYNEKVNASIVYGEGEVSYLILMGVPVEQVMIE